MQRLLLVVFLLLTTLCSSALVKRDTSIPKDMRTKLLFSFDSRNSFAFGTRSKMFGIRFGWQRKKVNRYGIGLYNMIDDVVLRNINDQNQMALVDFGYVSFFYERVHFQTKKWEIATPVFIGSGAAEVRIFNEDGSIIYDEFGNSLSGVTELNFGLIGFSANAQYKFRRWIGLGAGLGYRQVLSGTKELRKAYNSPIYVIKLKIFIGEFFKKNPDMKK